MTLPLVLEQTFNGLQLGVMLFLMAAGLTLVLGIMNLINLAHGSLYMLGAYLVAMFQAWTGSFLAAVVLALPAVAAVGMLVELIVFRRLYRRDHLDQVLATFGLILFFNELVGMIWGRQAIFVELPAALAGSIEILPGAPYPMFRLLILAVGLVVAILLYLIIHHSRLGVLIRAGASNREMAGALGIDIATVFTLVFGLGAALAGLAGMMAAPLLSVEAGMGETILILAFVVIVIGGIGSVRGAFVAAVLVGLVDTWSRILLPAGAGQMSIYLLMAAVLFWRPRGLFAAQA
jgi:branched-chain amino acid transport system permease protein